MSMGIHGIIYATSGVVIKIFEETSSKESRIFSLYFNF